MLTAYGAAFGTFLKKGTVVLGSDSRPSGEMVRAAVIAGLIATGREVIDIGIVPTPTVEIAVKQLKASGGICVTASHNPAQWNALKFFNARGEFITPEEYLKLNQIFESGSFQYVPVTKLGRLHRQDHWADVHIRKTIALPVINRAAIKKRKFKIVIDAINGAGSIALPKLCEQLGARVVRLNCKGDGDFVHMPEPIPANLKQLAAMVKSQKADIGFATDPDADRLVLVNEKGETISEELTLTVAVKAVLSRLKGKKKPPTVINLSTSSATADVALEFGSPVVYSKVGESNVVQTMHKFKGVIGGEGNGGVIYPEFHAGRDALVGAALVMSYLAENKLTLGEVVATLPKYYSIKSKAELPGDFEARLRRFSAEAPALLGGEISVDTRDGVRFDFPGGWVQLRKSNTEPIYRLIVETRSPEQTRRLEQTIRQFFSAS